MCIRDSPGGGAPVHRYQPGVFRHPAGAAGGGGTAQSGEHFAGTVQWEGRCVSETVARLRQVVGFTLRITPSVGDLLDAINYYMEREALLPD